LWHRILDPAPVSIVMLVANPQIGHANMPSPQSEIERYLRSGEHDPLFGARIGGNMLECARRGDADLRQALVAEVKARTATVRVPEALIDLDCEAFARAKVAPMVRGLFSDRRAAGGARHACSLAGLPHPKYYRGGAE